MSTTYRAIHRFAPMTARKTRPIVNLVRGLGVNQAMEDLLYVNRRASILLQKVIKSAVANAAQEGGVESRQLVILQARVNDGPLKQRRMRWRPGPMGRAMPIHKRTCHIEVVLGVDKNAPPAKRDEEPSATQVAEQGES